ncbi:MAG: hypothetical protein IKG04_08630 [Exiguobacterium sp.]|nr:hypothetical protein [Exiguobacterium sp.]
MKPFNNIEIFDRELNFKSNTAVERVDINLDYLSPEQNTISLRDVTAAVNDYVRIASEEGDYFGIISETEIQKNGITKVTIKDLATIFDVNIVIDSDDMVGTLESFIASTITNLYISNPDASMNINASVSTETETNDWILEVDPMADDTTLCTVNLFDQIILPAFKAYGIIVKTSVDLGDKALVFTITKNESAPITIEADLPEVIEKNITVREAQRQVNKLTVYNSDDYSAAPITFYLHPDGTFSTEDADRIVPVKWTYDKAAASDKGGESKTFAQNAEETAARVFAAEEYNNIITLSYVEYPKFNVGQKVNIISNGVVYPTVFTAIERGSATKLIFGMIRLSLIKTLKGRG